MAPIGTQTLNCFSRVRRAAGLPIPGRDTDCMSCSVFICALRSLYSVLKSIPLQYIYNYTTWTSSFELLFLGYNADLICLQEVYKSAFDQKLLPVFSALGFTGRLCLKNGILEGAAIFFRNEKFKCAFFN